MKAQRIEELVDRIMSLRTKKGNPVQMLMLGQDGVCTGTNRCSKRIAASIIVPLIFLLFFVHSLALSQEHHSPGEHAGMSMPTDEPTQAELLSWKHESEFNHHLIGVFLVLGGLFILAEGALKNRFPAVRYVWPVCFLLSGLFIPNPEVIQHKIFAVMLLGVGLVEMERVRERLKAVWAAWVFPVLAVAGSVLLLFHFHDTGMQSTDHMAIMERIQAEHLSYAVTGFGIGLVKGVAEVRTRWRTVFSRLWPTLMIVLGVLLMFYHE
jgi:hypothetical protein